MKPKLRFPGFTDEWEEKKLGELTQLKVGKSFTSELNDDGCYIVMDMGTITPEGFCVEYKKTNIKRDLLQKDDLVMPKDDIGGGLIICKTAHIPNDNQYVLGDHVYRLRFKNQEGLFMHYLINSPKINKELKKKVTGSAQLGIKADSVSNQTVRMPIHNEQIQIAFCFFNLDRLITLHQHKYEEYKALKQSMLQKMFPKKGEKVPEIRFPGFTDDWEQRKLSSIATMHARIGWQNLRKSEFLDSGDYYLITGTDFVDGEVDLTNCHYVEKDRYEQDRNIQIRNGSILITKDGTLGKVAYVKGLDKPATLNAGVFNVVITDKKVDGKYLFQYLKAPFLMDYVDQKATGGTIKHLNQNILVDFPVILPSYEEQKQLGELFSSLDNLITLHQRKRNQYKELKKGLLQQMFV